MDPEEYAKLFNCEGKLWWFLGMRRISTDVLDRYLPVTPVERCILDAGCGTGGMLEVLRLYGRVFGLDASPQALVFANKRPSTSLVQGDVCRLPFASQVFDLVTSFDVIYHSRVPNDETALLEAARVLRPNGRLLLRVPALELPRGRHDAAVHTRHRYRRKEIEEKLKRTGFTPEFVSYANCFLLPIAILRRGSEHIARNEDRGSEVESPPLGLNRALYWILRLEALWLRYASLPFGLSVVAIARKEVT